MTFLRKLVFTILFLQLIVSCKEGEESFEIDIEEGFPIQLDFGTADSVLVHSTQTGKLEYLYLDRLRVKNLTEDTIYMPIRFLAPSDETDPNYSYLYGHSSIYLEYYRSSHSQGYLTDWDFPDSFAVVPPSRAILSRFPGSVKGAFSRTMDFGDTSDSIGFGVKLYSDNHLDSVSQWGLLDLVYKKQKDSIICCSARSAKNK